MGKIMVVEKSVLFPNGRPPTGLFFSSDSYLQTILSKHLWLERNDELEHNTMYKQPIVYSAIINPLKGILVYRRKNKKGKVDERLFNKWSIGFGGHIDYEKDCRSDCNPLVASARRELAQEIGFFVPIDLHIYGYINEEDSVGSVHLCILNIVMTTVDNFKVVDTDEIAEVRLASFSEAEEIFNAPGNEAEGWTKIGFPFLRERFAH